MPAKVGLRRVEEREATEVSEARSHENAVGRNTPTSRTVGKKTNAYRARRLQQSQCPHDPPKRFERRENARIPGQAAWNPNSTRRPRSESCGSDPGAYEVRVHAVSYEWQRSIGRIARLVHRETARSRGDQGRALAGRKLEAPPDAGHGWREGESVREYVQAIKSSRVFGPWVSARRFKIRLKAFSDSRPSGLYGCGDAGVL